MFDSLRKIRIVISFRDVHVVVAVRIAEAKLHFCLIPTVESYVFQEKNCSFRIPETFMKSMYHEAHENLHPCSASKLAPDDEFRGFARVVTDENCFLRDLFHVSFRGYSGGGHLTQHNSIGASRSSRSCN